jgi:hypothetical protein
MMTFFVCYSYRSREESDLTNDIEESGHVRFLRDACLANTKGSVVLILAKDSVMRMFPYHLICHLGLLYYRVSFALGDLQHS